MIVQRLKVKVSSPYSLAEKYYTVVSAVNDLKLTQRDIQFIAFVSSKEGWISVDAKKEFCEKYETTLPTISNTVHKLKRLSIFVKDDGKLVIHPSIRLNFQMDVELNIVFKHAGNNQ